MLKANKIRSLDGNSAALVEIAGPRLSEILSIRDALPLEMHQGPTVCLVYLTLECSQDFSGQNRESLGSATHSSGFCFPFSVSHTMAGYELRYSCSTAGGRLAAGTSGINATDARP